MRRLALVKACLFLLLGTSIAQAKLDLDASINFDVDGQVSIWKLKDLQKHVPAYEVTLFNPVYKKTMSYRAFKFAEVAKLAKIDIFNVQQISFIARDGYEAVLTQPILKRFPKPWLAFEELSTAHGETFSLVGEGKEITDPAPYYLLWQKPESYKAFPWPFAITKITVNVKFDPYFELKPKQQTTVKILRGFEVFKTRCMACHSINLVGGSIGPELNIPKNITEYRTMTFLKAWIKDPTSFRAKSRMANFGTVSEHQIDDVIAYIKYMKNYKTLEKLNH